MYSCVCDLLRRCYQNRGIAGLVVRNRVLEDHPSTLHELQIMQRVRYPTQPGLPVDGRTSPANQHQTRKGCPLSVTSSPW